MKKKAGDKVVVWAVDPLDPGARPSARAVRELARWCKEWGLGLQPVFVMPFAAESFVRGSLSAVDEMQNLLDEYVGEYGVAHVLPPALILDEAGTRQAAVRELVAYSKKAKAAAIVLSSHGRTGLQRFVLGSFAELVWSHAAVPVLFLSRQQPKARGRRTIFPTDFSGSSRKVFRRFLQMARPLGAEVVLFHAISLPPPLLEGGGDAAMSASVPESYFSEEEARVRKESVAWIREAKEAGVAVRLLINREGIMRLTGEVILEAAEQEEAFLIALAAQSGPLEHFVFGSAAMDVFRASRFPVWISGPRFLAKSHRAASATLRKPKPMKASRRRAP